MKDKSVRFFIALNVILGAIFTLVVYYALDIYGENLIISKDMLRTLKAYIISDISVIRNKLIFRIIVLVVLFALYIKKKVNIIKLVLYVYCFKWGFLFMIFFLEMKLYGMINYICIVSPPSIIYIVVLKKIYERCMNNVYAKDLKIYFNVITGWSVGMIYELVIKLLMVHQCLIIPS